MGRAVTCVLVLLAILRAAGATACDQSGTRYEPRSFLGYACAQDCERHKAGFVWAAQRGLTGSATCRGLAPAEFEGCLAWVEEGLDAEAAGARWAVENEIVAPNLCDGAGAEFRNGCQRQIAWPEAN